MTVLLAALELVQLAILAGLAVFGLHRGWLVVLHLRAARRRPAAAPASILPTVTVQLPLYNERHVAARLIRAVAALDYPRDRLRVQVLDDSDDGTTAIVGRELAGLGSGLAITHLRRPGRVGYKAGALAYGLARTDTELIAVFDADFVPPPPFLRELVGAFADPRVGMVQARWEHLNPGASLLTAAQRLLLDGHFVVEHHARAGNGRFFNFNGTAGVFRRACIDDAGGWQHDTLTEDLDLSYRAQLRGWRFVYRLDAACPAELPVRMNDFLGQQHRWAKGAIQTGRKLLPRLLRSPLPLGVKIEAAFHLLGNAAFVMLLGLMLVTLPLQGLRLLGGVAAGDWMRALEGAPLGLSLACVLLYYGTAQATLHRFGPATVLRLPVVLALGAGMTVNNTAAFFAGCRGPTGAFNRTPKAGAAGIGELERNPRGALPLLELALATWTAATSVLSLLLHHPWTALFHALFAAGLGWVGGRSLRESLPPRRTAAVEAVS